MPRTTSLDTAPPPGRLFGRNERLAGFATLGKRWTGWPYGTCDSVDVAVTQDGSNRSISGIPT
jgi:hypothetical protein